MTGTAGSGPGRTDGRDPDAGDRALARYQRALRLAQEFETFADDGSDVTPW